MKEADTVIDLRVADPKVWEYICQLQRQDALGGVTKVRCSICNEWLGTAATTTVGPGFAGTYRDYGPMFYEIRINGEPLKPREMIEYMKARATVVEGDYWDKQRRGYFAPLAIPPDLPQEYVPLVVRCMKHGDLILDRTDVITALRRKFKTLRVTPLGERYTIIEQQTEGLQPSGQERHSRMVRHIGGPLDPDNARHAES
ncbi:MAG: hypothetical protein LKJ18_00595 [Ancrocorticia sp.]|jgi:hypothetical protein|nr:hypothetical protein [Ancrocorticia sp.]MCI2002437.1 hypothetical protein [Ancrocorticia sp.]